MDEYGGNVSAGWRHLVDSSGSNFGHALTDDFWLRVAGAVLLGFGTALVYPTRRATIGALGHCDAWQKTLR